MADGESSAAGTSSTSLDEANGTTDTPDPTAATDDGDPPTSTATSRPTTTTTSIFSPNLEPQELTIAASPEAVDFTITLQDGTTMTGATPFTDEVPGGNIRVDFNKPGYNPKFKTLALTDTASFKV